MAWQTTFSSLLICTVLYTNYSQCAYVHFFNSSEASVFSPLPSPDPIQLVAEVSVESENSDEDVENPNITTLHDINRFVLKKVPITNNLHTRLPQYSESNVPSLMQLITATTKPLVIDKQEIEVSGEKSFSRNLAEHTTLTPVTNFTLKDYFDDEGESGGNISRKCDIKLGSLNEDGHSLSTFCSTEILSETQLNSSDSGEIESDLNQFSIELSPTFPPVTNARLELMREFRNKYPVALWANVGFYNDEYLELINSHWLQFEPAEQIVHKVLSILYTLIMVIGCGGNLLVIVMFIRCRSLRTPPNYLIVNLAISDFCMLAKMPIFIYNSLYGGPVLGAVGCKIYGFVGGLTGTTSIMTLAVISLDRYYVIVHPLNMLRRTSSSRAILMLAAVWGYSGIFSSLPLFGVNSYVSEGYLTSCSFDYLSEKLLDRIFVGVFFVAAWVFPLGIIVFSYVNIFWAVQEAKRLEFFNSDDSARVARESYKCKHDKKKRTTELKIAVLSSVVILIWTLAWTPYAIVALLGIFGFKEMITPLISAIPALFCKTASCVDPFLYAINHPRFQRELRNKCSICFPRSTKASNEHSNRDLTTNATVMRQTTVSRTNPASIRNNERSIDIQGTSETSKSIRMEVQSRRNPKSGENDASNSECPGNITFAVVEADRVSFTKFSQNTISIDEKDEVNKGNPVIKSSTNNTCDNKSTPGASMSWHSENELGHEHNERDRAGLLFKENTQANKNLALGSTGNEMRYRKVLDEGVSPSLDHGRFSYEKSNKGNKVRTVMIYDVGEDVKNSIKIIRSKSLPTLAGNSNEELIRNSKVISLLHI